VSVAHEWTGASFVVLGDSILAQGAEALDTVRDRLGFAGYRSVAVNGQTMTEAADGSDPATVAVALGESFCEHALAWIGVGTNDFKRALPIGDLDGATAADVDRSTFTGAYRTTIEHVLGDNPAIRLVLATPLQRSKDGLTTDHVNDAGHTLDDYAQAIRDLGRAYALPVCDLYADSGFSRLTLPLLTDDGLHPNATGYVRLGNRITAFLRTIGA
jgi:lysophospholipase L1-like esterase